MTYQAPYAARYVSAAGNQIQLLNLWDDTPEPPRFGGSMEAFETSLVDGPRAFAQGLGSAVEQRTIAFYRWFVDFQDMASYQENIALWLASNQTAISTCSSPNSRNGGLPPSSPATSLKPRTSFRLRLLRTAICAYWSR